jgi:Ca2+:H+ antiporter
VLKRLLGGNWLNLLLVFVPVALVLDYGVHASPILVFVASCLGVVPLAGIMGQATEHLAERMGEGIGGLLNATFGNAAELIIAIIALRAGLFDLVKASITGSIIGNILLVMGLSTLAGGIKHETQRFNATAAAMGTTMLVLSAVGLLVPAVFHAILEGGGVTQSDVVAQHSLSLYISIVLIVTYALGLVFTLRTHRYLYVGDVSREDDEPGDVHPGPAWRPVLTLLAATAGVAVMAELLVGAAEATAHALGWSDVFVGVIVVAIIGNAAEHSTAVLMALKDKMDVAINIAVGSSIQVALFVAPVLVFLSHAIAPKPMDLIFTRLEVLAVGVSVGIMGFIANDGESHWMEGVQLLAVYAILGIAFFFLPVPR